MGPRIDLTLYCIYLELKEQNKMKITYLYQKIHQILVSFRNHLTEENNTSPLPIIWYMENMGF